MNKPNLMGKFIFFLAIIGTSLACVASDLDPNQGTAIAKTIEAVQAGTQTGDDLGTAVAGTLAAGDSLAEESDTATATPASSDSQNSPTPTSASDTNTPAPPAATATPWIPPRAGAIDFNGDGYEDLAVGVFGLDVDGVKGQGGFYELLGGPSALNENGVRLWSVADLVKLDPESGATFGISLSAADFDGDGYTDVAAGYSERIENQGGGVFVVYGSPQGLDESRSEVWKPEIHRTLTKTEGGAAALAEHSNSFGTAVSAGDFNGDGLAELAIGGPRDGIASAAGAEPVLAGIVHIFYGTATGLQAENGQRITQNEFVRFVGASIEHQGDLIGVDEENDWFGVALLAGDLNTDGASDLVIGSPAESFGEFAAAGAVYVVFGSPQGLKPQDHLQISQDGIHQDENGDGIAESSNNNGLMEQVEGGEFLGIGLAAGDFDGNGYDDLAIGAPGEDLGADNEMDSAGVVHIMYGQIWGIHPFSEQQVWNQRYGLVGDEFIDGFLRGEEPEELDLFGYALTSGDFDGDNFEDLAVGAPGETLGEYELAGSISVIYGSENGLATNKSQSLNQHAMESGSVSDEPLLSSPSLTESLGQALAVGDFNRDGILDLVAGSPNDDGRGAGPSGAIFILFGAPDLGLVAVDQQRWTENGGADASGQIISEMPAQAVEFNNFGNSLP